MQQLPYAGCCDCIEMNSTLLLRLRSRSAPILPADVSSAPTFPICPCKWRNSH